MATINHGGNTAFTKLITLVKNALAGKVDAVAGKGLSANDLTDDLKTAYDGAVSKVAALEATGGQANVIESVSVNGVAQEVSAAKGVDITVPTKTSEITNDSEFQTAEQVQASIDTAVSSAYKASGSIAFADLPAATKANLGKVYNITEEFTTTADFLEGAGITYPAGTNVAIVQNGTTYHYDVMAGFVDTSAFVKSSDITEMTADEVQTIWDSIA